MNACSTLELNELYLIFVKEAIDFQEIRAPFYKTIKLSEYMHKTQLITKKFVESRIIPKIKYFNE